MTGPKTLRTLLAAYRPAGERVAAGGEAGALSAAWPDAVGVDVARRTRAGAFRDGALTVLTPSSAWSHQLTFLAPTIIERLRERCPGVDLRRLKFAVASGRSRALLAGNVGARSSKAPGPAAADRASAVRPGPGLDEAPAAGDDLEMVLARLRRAQTQLDERRAQAGWQRCSTCSCWCTSPPLCGVCREQARRAADGAIGGVLANAPWLKHAELRRELPAADARSYERVRRALMTQCELQMFNARARLRRDALDAADRVAAWSFVMLATQQRKEELSGAVLASVLGRQWADALLRDGQRKAPRPVREKPDK
ncbi:MAG TPA: DUF721 domain-containing protein [Candidatus Eremiobacteraceae bacterium]|nr:DUF721 domain-containing protein [Candidatus Eremiobacteraceae bacterium]